MESALVRERRRPHVGSGAVGGAIQRLVDEARERRHVTEIALARHLLDVAVQGQTRYYGAEVGVAGPLAYAVDRPLLEADTCPHGREGVRHGKTA